MARAVEALCPSFGVATVGLDGYHYPNAYLLSHRTPPEAAEAGPLKLYKGAHFTYNTARLVADLRRVYTRPTNYQLPTTAPSRSNLWVPRES